MSFDTEWMPRVDVIGRSCHWLVYSKFITQARSHKKLKQGKILLLWSRHNGAVACSSNRYGAIPCSWKLYQQM